MPLPSLVLFARAPEPGRVKTRLAGRLTDAGAAELYRSFLSDASRVYREPERWESVLYAESDPSNPSARESGFAWRSLFPPPWRLEVQSSGDLGDRLLGALTTELGRGVPAAVAVGSDHPSLPRRRLREAFDALGEPGGAEVVLIPAEDGGYCAIGLTPRAPAAELFGGIPWSTDRVLAETVARLEVSGTRHRLLEAAYDVDRPEDLERLRVDLARRDETEEDFPRATARMLARIAGARRSERESTS